MIPLHFLVAVSNTTDSAGDTSANLEVVVLGAVLPDAVVVAVADSGLEERVDSVLATSTTTDIVEAVRSGLVRARDASLVKVNTATNDVGVAIGLAGQRQRVSVYERDITVGAARCGEVAFEFGASGTWVGL